MTAKKTLTRKEIENMLSLYGSDFICAVYRAILNREPDVTGLEHYSRMISSGASRVQIILDIMNSDEGKSKCKKSKIIILYKYIKKMTSLPIVGRIITICIFLWNIERFLVELRIELDKLRRGQ